MPFPDRHIRPEHYPTIIGIPPLQATLKKPHCGLRRRNTILRETTMSAAHTTTRRTRRSAARAVLAAAAATALAGTALATFMAAGPAGAATTGTGIDRK